MLFVGQPGTYQYMKDLLHLDACSPKGETLPSHVLGSVNSPLRWQEWDAQLSSYPDQRLRAYIVEGIRWDFHIGYNYDTVCCHSKGNIRSSLDNPQVFRDYLATEIKAGRITGPLDLKQCPCIHTSRFGVIPKSTPGKWRLMVDMSSPEGESVNDGIRESWCLLSYATVMNAAHGITAFGKGTLMIKVNILAQCI